jgi:hypothetical protein
VSTDGAAIAAARAGAPASLQLSLGNNWPGQLQWCERKGVGACIFSEGTRSERLGGDLQWRTAAEQTGGREMQARKRDSSGSCKAVDDALAHRTTTLVATWAQHGRAACGAYGGARLVKRRGRRDAARAGVASGDREEASDGGSQGWPTAHGPAGQSRPRRAGPAGPRRGSVRDAGVACDVARVGAVNSI